MATDGSISLSIAAGVSIKLNWSLYRQNGMESEIFYEVILNYSGTKAIALQTNLTVNGKSLTYGSPMSNNGKRIDYGYITVKRSLETNKGTLSFTLACSAGEYWYTGSEYDGEHSFSSNNKSNTWTISTTTPSGESAKITAVSDFSDEISPTITYTYDRGNNVDAVSLLAGISFTGENMDIPYREINSTENTYTFNFEPDELDTLYTLLANGTSASVRFYIQTIETIDGETINLEPNFITKTFSFDNYWPLIKPTLVDTNEATKVLTGNPNHLVRYMSNVAYNMNVELRKGALDVIGCYIQNGGKIQEGFESGTFINPTSNVFYFSATDDRGYTGTASKSLSMFDGEFINYIKLTSSIKSTPISGEGNMTFTITGKYFNANFGAAQNKLIVQYAVYKKGTTPSWSTATEVTPEMLDNETYSVSINESGLDYTAQYVVAVKVNDLLMNSESSIAIVAKPVFYWNNEEFIFNIPVTFNEGATGASGNDLFEDNTASGYYMSANGQYLEGNYTWYYRKWTDGLLECWCTVPIITPVDSGWGNMYVANSSNMIKTDLCYPVEPTGTPVITATIGAGATRGILIADDSYAADKISTGRYNIASPVSITNYSTFRINYYIRGRWK